jgi:hypothetical protein
MLFKEIIAVYVNKYNSWFLYGSVLFVLLITSDYSRYVWSTNDDQTKRWRQKRKERICKLWHFKFEHTFPPLFMACCYKQNANHVCVAKGEPATPTQSTTYKSASQIPVARIPIDASQ